VRRWLRGHGVEEPAPRPLRVFLSHTSDLRATPAERSFVAAAEDAVKRAGHAVTDMAYFSARHVSPAHYCRTMMSRANVYVGIVGHRYGTPVREHPDRSYTELEFETASALGLPRLIFFIDAAGPPDPDAGDDLDARQRRFRLLLRESAVTIADVTSPDELEIRLYQALMELGAAEASTPAVRPLGWVRPLAGALLGATIAVSVIARSPPGPGQIVWAAVVGVAGAVGGFAAGAGSASALRSLARRRGAGGPLVDDPLQRRRHRAHLRGLVRRHWVETELERSLGRLARIELGFAERPGAVDNPLRVVVRRGGEPDLPLERGTRIGAAFHQLHEQMLILGAPGAGKTTTLLELASELLDETRRLDLGPIPVVFHLSSWTPRSGPLADWLASELQQRYDVPPALGRHWVATDQVIPLLDGLDEVRTEHREACVGALNAFRVAHGQLPIVVCSRVREYDELRSKLALRGALVVQPLSREEVDQYLHHAGPALNGVRAVLREDDQLAELLTSPLFLSIVVLTYSERQHVEVPASASRELRRRRILADYVLSMLDRPRARPAASYGEDRVVRWLAWLADVMRAHGQSVLYVDWMQPDWLASAWQRRVVTIGVPVVVGTIAGVAVGANYAFASQLVQGPHTPLAVRAIVGATTGLIALACSAWASRDSTITPTGQLHWSWPALRHGFPGWLATGLILGGSYGLVFGLATAPVLVLAAGQLFPGQAVSLADGLVLGPAAGVMYGMLSGVVLGSTFGLLSGLAIGFDPRPTAPDRGIHTSGRNALLTGTAGGMLVGGVFWLVFGLGYALTGPAVHSLAGAVGFSAVYWPHAAIEDVLVTTFVSGLVIAARFGGGAYVRHQILRQLLVHSGCAPRDYVAFLEYTTRLILLRRRGGGYEFVHRMLLEHFADLPVSQRRPAGAQTV
jgi:hypothetical protein